MLETKDLVTIGSLILIVYGLICVIFKKTLIMLHVVDGKLAVVYGVVIMGAGIILLLSHYNILF